MEACLGQLECKKNGMRVVSSLIHKQATSKI